ncbi:MAG: hypothetical protein IJB88_06195 [Clostridia bacterium]|nr:hypothetical protein [Clostridia bacterium]
MYEHKTIAFRMPCGMPAASVAILRDGGFAAVDGRTCEAAIFSPSGALQETVCTTRAYRALRLSKDPPTEGLFFALGSCCIGTPARVYLLNCRFEEIGSFDLVTDGHACCADTAELTDITPVGHTVRATYRHSIRAHGFDGLQTEIILPTDRSRFLLRYAVSGTAQALAFCKNGMTFLNVSEIGAVYLGTSPDGLTVRDLVPHGLGDIYGLFGYRYLYNYLMPIYQNGAFCLPSDGGVSTVLQSIFAHRQA